MIVVSMRYSREVVMMKLLMMNEVIVWRYRNDDIANEVRKNYSLVNCGTKAGVSHTGEMKNSSRPIGWEWP